MSHFLCSKCGRRYPADTRQFRCSCGGTFDLDFRARFPVHEIEKRSHNMWRYREALPVEFDCSIVSMSEGCTALVEEVIGGRSVFIKNDTLFPTGSFKDRGASVLISYAREHSVKSVVEDSSGNAGCSIAAYASRAGMRCEIFVPDSTSQSKLNQIAAYNSRVKLVKGSRDDVAREILETASMEFYASHVYNPFFLHGTKTFAFEVCEQLGWKSPDAVVVPVGNGTLLLGVAIGFDELRSEGVVNRVPKIIAVQSKNCSPLLQAFNKKSDLPLPLKIEKTIAEGIAIERPVRGAQILKAVTRSNGTFIGVAEDEIVEAGIEMAGRGFFIEPTAAATIAGLKKYVTSSSSHDLIVSVFSGHGLKTDR
ncbi:pyridoxal-5'-phosphate-dependent protein subunit beta [Mesotoga sp. SC_NapDC2]|nr:pyridoxal-5'-phosphate-dependent protein subunit beta [Mesotoga sp. SC_NapDC3]PXF35261.1 pyridoxal-5'-phosphate-dependent protein subunit beta [Mesotoga sp. SC_NapDC]RIZ61446.1 pyridoxal-5'-phosphate-dependent protein subunit beta [Mesotoga sp. SC_NapDC2]HAY98197.1 threonine synthase [Mesotoga sp.]